ncbi:exported hypothetical protein [Verrucomicrobia bacterium]|nr:exported hypothetical protein [Verrucomicrobiota bacterium]
MLKEVKRLGLAWLSGCWLCGCTTVSVYQTPVADFQKAVNTANDSIRPYLLGVNNLIAEANLYDKVGMGKDWGTEDLHAGIPPEEIQVRLQALSTIASYANALGAVANSTDVAQLGQAAQGLGDDVNGLNTTIQGLAAKRTARAGQGASANQAATLDLSGPVSSLVTLVGTLVIEGKQKAALEAAILNGDKPVAQLIELLRSDLRALALVDDASYGSIQTGMVKLYNDARGKTDPKSLIALIDDFVQKNNSIQTLRALQVDSLLSDMENAHAALVTFAKSRKGPKDLSDLAAQIDVFTAHVKLFADAIASVQSAINASK